MGISYIEMDFQFLATFLAEKNLNALIMYDTAFTISGLLINIYIFMILCRCLLFVILDKVDRCYKQILSFVGVILYICNHGKLTECIK